MKAFKYFLAAILFSIPFWWGINSFGVNLENYFFSSKLAYDSSLLSAQAQEAFLAQKLEEAKPLKKGQAENLEIGSPAVSVLFDKQTGKIKNLFEKGSTEKLPIASLTKLMTVYVVLKNYNLDDVVTISQEAVDQDEDFGQLKVGEKFKVSELLYPVLIESSNDAAYSLAEVIGVDSFVDLMNIEAKNMGLENTRFINPTGLTPDKGTSTDYSTAEDLVRLTESLLDKPLVWDILSKKEYYFYEDGLFHHKIENTNELLRADKPWADRIIGGKTGWTPEAKGCLVIVLKAPKSGEYLIDVVLGSDDRFGEMTKLIDWVYQSYRW